jgi:hypothetical protein
VGRRLQIRKATAPYYRPWVIVDIDSKECIGHYRTELEAKQSLALMDGVDISPSNLQATRKPLESLKIRLQNPIGAKPPVDVTGSTIVPGLRRRKIQL